MEQNRSRAVKVGGVLTRMRLDQADSRRPGLAAGADYCLAECRLGDGEADDAGGPGKGYVYRRKALALRPPDWLSSRVLSGAVQRGTSGSASVLALARQSAAVIAGSQSFAAIGQ